MGQDKVWKETTSKHSHAFGAAGTATVHEETRQGQQEGIIERAVPIRDTQGTVAGRRVSTKAAYTQQDGNALC